MTGHPMRKILKTNHTGWFYSNGYFSMKTSNGVSIENFKRRRALPSFDTLDAGSRLFFERILNVKKVRDFVFITRAKAKNR